jgi:hypothetical protein
MKFAGGICGTVLIIVVAQLYCLSVCNVAEIGESWDFHQQGTPPALGYWFFRPREGDGS